MPFVSTLECLVQQEPAAGYVGRDVIQERKIQRMKYLSMSYECLAVVMCTYLQNCKSCLYYPVYYTGIGWVDVYFEPNFALGEISVKHCSSRAAADNLNFPRD